MNRVAELARPRKPVHALAERTAFLEVVLRERPNLDPVDRRTPRLAAGDRHGLLDIEAQRLVQAERAHVESVLQEPDSRRVLSALDDGLHQPPSHARVLTTRIDRDRPHPSDRAALVEEVRADDLAIAFGDHPPDRRVRYPGAHHLGGGLEYRKVTLEAVMVVNVAEGVEDDLRTRRNVIGRCLTKLHVASLNAAGGARTAQ
jgi:hypothetical protein